MTLFADKSNSNIRQQVRGMLCVAIALCLFDSVGCRSIGSNRRTKELSAARQRSLQGTDEMQQKNWPEAERLFSEALRRSQSDERAQWGMAEVLYQRGEFATAIAHMEAAARLSGENPDLLVRLGEMHLQAGRLEEAQANASQALQGNRQCAAAWALRGQVLRQRQQHSEALQSYHRALICQPNNPAVQLEIAELYRELQRPQRALATLDRMGDAQAGANVSARAWLLRGQALADLGQRKDAQHCLNMAAGKASDSDITLLVQLAQSQFDAGELAEARICLGRVLQQDPGNAEALAIQAEVGKRFFDNAHSPAVQAFPVGFGNPLILPK